MLHINEFSVFDDITDSLNFESPILNEILEAMKFMDYIKNDEQLDNSHENYIGFVNVSTDFVRDKEMQNNFKAFVKHNKLLRPLLHEMNLDIEPFPDEDETIIHNK